MAISNLKFNDFIMFVKWPDFFILTILLINKISNNKFY